MNGSAVLDMVFCAFVFPDPAATPAGFPAAVGPAPDSVVVPPGTPWLTSFEALSNDSRFKATAPDLVGVRPP